MRVRVLRLRAYAPALALAVLCALLSMMSGCAAAITSLAPAALGVGEYAGIKAADKSGDRHTVGPRDEQGERCETLVQTPPGVEEIRKNKDDSIDSRQWRLIASTGGTKWAIVRAKMAPPDGWQPKPGIANLKFSPSLPEQLEAGGDSQFLAYAPDDTKTIADSDQETTLTEVFGPTIGSFQWRGRSYGYVLVKTLPCFKPLD